MVEASSIGPSRTRETLQRAYFFVTLRAAFDMLDYPCDYPDCKSRSQIVEGNCTDCCRHLCESHNTAATHVCRQEGVSVSASFPPKCDYAQG